jgi:hypothetical protein
MTRDPRSDPQPGDMLRGNLIFRRVIKREGEKVLIQSEHTRYWMRVERWQLWCEQSNVQAATATQDG